MLVPKTTAIQLLIAVQQACEAAILEQEEPELLLFPCDQDKES